MTSAVGSASAVPPVISPRDQMRRAMRMRRRALTDEQYAKAARGLARVVTRQCWLRPGRRIAIYLPYGRELDPGIVIRMALQRRCSLYVPLVTNMRTHRMEFVRLKPGERLRRNRFGIQEPPRHAAERIAVRELDLILLPLVAVDEHGWRLGSGAGFYDRRLHHLRAGRRWRKPRLIGVAYEFQRVPRLDPAPWDVPLDAVITERALYLTPSTSLPGTDRGFS
jgi:5-formyltetrahydrofolate cyclo-ligase